MHTQLKRLDAHQRFLYFIHARENLRHHKELIGTTEFTQDDILRRFRFCNINREDDTVTKWIKRNLRDKIQGRPEQVLNMCIARIYNQPSTLQHIGITAFHKSGIEHVRRCVRCLQSDGHKIMRGAYMVAAHGTSIPVVDYYHEVLEAYLEFDWQKMETLAAVHAALSSVTGFGDFLANQVVTDLRYTPEWSSAPDWETFVACGPGTRRGVNRYVQGEPLTKPGANLTAGMTSDKAAAQLLLIRQRILPDCTSELRNTFRDINNLSNSFCEWDKYERVLWTPEGTSLRIYQ